MDYFENNIKLIEGLKDTPLDLMNNIYPLELAKDGNFTFKLNNTYFHSKYDPIKEAEKLSEIILNDKENIDIWVIFGGGLGYIQKYLYKQLLFQNNNSIKPYIIYIEKDLNIFLTSIKCFDWNDELKDENYKIFLSTEKEVIGSFIQHLPSKKIRYCYHRPSFNLFEEYYKDIQNYINYILNRKDMNAATLKRFQKLWTSNFIYNIPNYLKSNPINKLKNIAQNSTSIVVAGGPSLDKCFDFLKNIQGKAIIIAVDTVYKILRKNGINPDIVATVDPQYWNYKFLENVNDFDSIVITDASVYHKVLSITKPEKYFIGNSIFPIVKYFDKTDRGNLSAGGSVATTAYDTARIIGSSNIVLVGLDLSFPDRKTHFHGAFFETNFLTFSTYYNTAEDNAYKYLTHVDLIPVKSTIGEVFSDQKMILFRKWFDREVQITNARVFQLDFGGAVIDGTTIVSIEKLIDYSLFSYDKKEYVKIINNIITQKNEECKYIEKINTFIEYAQDIKISCDKITDLIKPNGEVKKEHIKIIEKEENRIFDGSIKHEIANIISSTAQDILIAIIENDNLMENDEKISAWKKTRLLFNSISELSDFYIKYFIKLLKVFG